MGRPYISMPDLKETWERSFVILLEDFYPNASSELRGPVLELPKDPSHGTFTSTVALRLAKPLKQPPAAIAAALREEIVRLKSTFPDLEDVAVAGPGFLNFRAAAAASGRAILGILERGDDYGRSDVGGGVPFQVEFVSANPTGPLTVAHGRQAAVGDVLAGLLAFAGYKVTREYYLNDVGNQMNLLGKSVYSRYRELHGKGDYPIPAEGYQGEYIVDVARKLQARDGDRHLAAPEAEWLPVFREFATVDILEWIRKDLADFGVTFDVYRSQAELESSGKVNALLDEFKASGRTFEKDGALWLKGTAFGDTEDRVLVKRDGSMTYRTPDIAYHREKHDRGFRRVVDLWGPDHHAHVICVGAALRALGIDDPKFFRVLLVQHCRLLRGTEEIKMSTRKAQYVTLREVMDEVGRDATRFFYAMRKTDSHLDFDLELAKKQSAENPVYKIQYLHARSLSVLRKAREERAAPAESFRGDLFDPAAADLGGMPPGEAEVVKFLERFPAAVEGAAEALEPHRIATYLLDLAGELNSFYQRGSKDPAWRILHADPATTRRRLGLLSAVIVVLRNGARILGISMPERM